MHEDTVPAPGAGENIVAAFTEPGSCKFALLEKVLKEGRFWEILEERLKVSGKAREDFLVAVKPNLSMLLRRSDVGTYSDPALLVHLLRLLALEGFTRLVVVESQNLYGNWFRDHSVVQVAARAALVDASLATAGENQKTAMIRVRGGGVDIQVPIVDLTLDKAPHDFGPPSGVVLLGKTWMDADFRISFAKLKTHFYGFYTLAIKNVYGCLPEQDKVTNYHGRRKVGPWTAEMIRDFPVHFSIVDAYTAADGWLGVKIRAICAKPMTMIAGADMMAVDRVGARLMGLAPESSIVYRSLAKLFPEKPFTVKGNAVRARPWRNTLYLLVRFCEIIDPWANIMSYMGALSTGGYDPCFSHKQTSKGPFKKLLFLLTLPANFLMDLGVVRLRLREALFRRGVRALKHKAPLAAGSDFILSRLTYFGREDVSRFTEMAAQGLAGQVEMSGHHLFWGDKAFTFPARLFTANTALIEILDHLRENKVEPKVLAAELSALLEASPDIFGKPGGFAYCYH